ncbi:MAG: PadR family transcriptional regulator [Acidimicrobiia bacterium]
MRGETRSGGGRHRRRGARCRWPSGPGSWGVQARVERFVEPALLLVLQAGPRHGYELADSLRELIPDEHVDVGNLYRLLRGLEAEGIVTSEWEADGPGPGRRTYTLTEAGLRLLDTWADALRRSATTVATFLDRYEGSHQ